MSWDTDKVYDDTHRWWLVLISVKHAHVMYTYKSTQDYELCCTELGRSEESEVKSLLLTLEQSYFWAIEEHRLANSSVSLHVTQRVEGAHVLPMLISVPKCRHAQQYLKITSSMMFSKGSSPPDM